MFFNRKWNIRSKMNEQEIRQHLVGKKYRIHQLDFEIKELDGMLKIIPHAENVEAIKTLPITHLNVVSTNNNQTDLEVSCKPRRIDMGPPYLVLLFICCLFLFALVYVQFFSFNGYVIPIALAGLGVVIFIIFLIRMNMGYFDYVRKIKNFTTSDLS